MVVRSEYTFLVGPISFSGLNFQLDGTIIAPTNAGAWGSGMLQWIEFTKLRGIRVQGSGTIEGRGSVWWSDSQLGDPVSTELGSRMPSTKPTVRIHAQELLLAPMTEPP